jgi:uncharacterized protein (TIGR02646 family)
MIPVEEKPEPADFAVNVRGPGQEFLRRISRPTKKQYGEEKTRYWVNAREDLFRAYSGVCAYCAQFVLLKDMTVDHYVPKCADPNLAYEWSNYRLSRKKLNNYKDNSLHVMDPFKIKYDWFSINFANFLVKPLSGLPSYLEGHVQTTIDILHLNEDYDLVRERSRVVVEYSLDVYPMAHLEKRYPFIAYELKRQGLEDEIKSIIRTRPRNPSDR